MMDEKTILKKLAAKEAGKERRTTPRFQYTGNIAIALGGSLIEEVGHAIAAVNLSTTGLLFLNATPIEEGSQVRIILEKRNLEPHMCDGVTVWWGMADGGRYRIGVKFDHPIKIEDFVEM